MRFFFGLIIIYLLNDLTVGKLLYIEVKYPLLVSYLKYAENHIIKIYFLPYKRVMNLNQVHHGLNHKQ